MSDRWPTIPGLLKNPVGWWGSHLWRFVDERSRVRFGLEIVSYLGLAGLRCTFAAKSTVQLYMCSAYNNSCAWHGSTIARRCEHTTTAGPS